MYVQKVSLIICAAIPLAALYAFYYRGDDSEQQIRRDIAEYGEAIISDPNDAKAWYGRAEAYVKDREYENAIWHYNRAIQLETNYKHFQGRAQAYYFQSDYDHAIVDLDEAIRLNPDVWLSFELRAKSRRLKGDASGYEDDQARATELRQRDLAATRN
jgi:tetratricopeptide (TPR) repeat protein